MFYIAAVIIAAILTVYYLVFKKTFIKGPFPRFGAKSLLADNKSEHWDDLKEKGKKWREAQSAEEVSIKSCDGLNLVGDCYLSPDARGVFILFHGYRSHPIKDFDCILEKYYTLGYSILVPDQRSHGRSEGRYITFGIMERFDCKSWVEYVKRRFGSDVPIYLDGLSMGATTVLMASGLDIDANIKGIIADCAFTSPRQIIEKVGCEDLHIPKWLFMPQLKLMCKLFAHFDLDAMSTSRALEKNKRPVIFIHGTADELVPYEMAREHYSAGDFDKELVSVEGATHGFSYIVDTELVDRKVTEFIIAHQ